MQNGSLCIHVTGITGFPYERGMAWLPFQKTISIWTHVQCMKLISMSKLLLFIQGRCLQVSFGKHQLDNFANPKTQKICGRASCSCGLICHVLNREVKGSNFAAPSSHRFNFFNTGFHQFSIVERRWKAEEGGRRWKVET